MVIRFSVGLERNDMQEGRAASPKSEHAATNAHPRLVNLFASFDRDFVLVDCSAGLRRERQFDLGTKLTLWELYPELVASRELLQSLLSLHIVTVDMPSVRASGRTLLLMPSSAGLSCLEVPSLPDVELPGDHERLMLRHQATHDVLTGLPNRRQFSDDLNGALALPPGAHIALMQLDLDDFKPVNDTLGHGAGDAVLRHAADRIRSALRSGATAYRLAGDEFAIILTEGPQPESAEQLAETLVRDFKKPFSVEGISVFVGTSIGVAVAPNDGEDAEQLMKAADIALYTAKKDGRGRTTTFDPGMLQTLEQRELLRRSLRTALVQKQFFLEYQPLIERSTVAGFEALLRWQHPLLGVIPPAAFIPVAEADGLMDEIGQWVLDQACREALTWPAHYSVAVNLSPAEFLTSGLTDRISQTLDVVGLSPERLELEITETVLLERTINNLDTLNTLNVLGIQIALDDFGTEYSSLSYLKNFPFDNIKIDKYFVSDLEEQQNSQTIVRFIIGLAHGLGMRVTAEGVETSKQAAWLEEQGCDRLQGYFFSRPVGPDGIPGIIARYPMKPDQPL
jgi:diguanylate cyclase (GGDEF)-like protein